jgi:23S rRNA (uracil1939-C5)-methyltransferase
VDSFRARLAFPSSVIAGRVEDHLPGALPADVVVLNPPRAGVDARVTAALDGVPRPPRAILYVSCDPATLARDVARMPRYRVASLRAYDMFPQTAHVETVCELVPEVA